MNEGAPKHVSSDAEAPVQREESPRERQTEAHNEELVQQYQQNRVKAEAALEAINRNKADNEQLQSVRESLGLDAIDGTSSAEEVAKLEAELVIAQANYPGNWTELLQSRLKDPATKQKFIDTRMDAMPSLAEGEVDLLSGPKKSRSYYIDQVENYDENLDSVFSYTQIGNADEFSKKPSNLGMGGIGEPGAVFTDGASRKSGPLTSRQKMIIEAHEKGHGIRDFQGADAAEIRSVLDHDVVLDQQQEAVKNDPQDRFANYLRHPAEIAERMAQLKNYFGFKGNEPLTKKHLDYAREHYIKDTGLDNNMTPFFAAITPETEPHFLHVINKYPL